MAPDSFALAQMLGEMAAVDPRSGERGYVRRSSRRPVGQWMNRPAKNRSRVRQNAGELEQSWRRNWVGILRTRRPAGSRNSKECMVSGAGRATGMTVRFHEHKGRSADQRRRLAVS